MAASARIGYLAHDLGDPAIVRRLRMLALGGAEVSLAGFLRDSAPPETIPPGTFPPGPKTDPSATPPEGPLVLGRTADARMGQRALAVGRVLAGGMPALSARMQGVDAIIARNLEMLAIARALQRRLENRPRLIYEILDLHRLLTAPGPAGGLMRRMQARLGQSVDLVVTSSPAYVTHHLAGMPFADRIILVQNKVLDTGPRPIPPPPARPAPPFRIGWFGALRCKRSFALLSGLAARLEGRVEVVLRGRPSPAVFPDFTKLVARAPHLRYHGPYRAEDLPAHYADVHFSWCIDHYEEGHNSTWLLPNRLYESAAHLAVPIALSGVETGRFLRDKGLGLVLERSNPDSLIALFAGMTDARHAQLRHALAESPADWWRSGPEDCRALVAAITGREPPDAPWPRLPT